MPRQGHAALPLAHIGHGSTAAATVPRKTRRVHTDESVKEGCIEGVRVAKKESNGEGCVDGRTLMMMAHPFPVDSAAAYAATAE